MTRDLDRIVVEVPVADSSQHRVEPRLFDQLDGLRAAQRAHRVAPDRARALPRWAWAVAGAMAIAIVILIVKSSGGHTAGVAPSLVVTPAGGASRFTIDDALIEAGSDTSVAVATDAGGGVTLTLARGSIDCDVAPRHGRPFHVIAGDVTVEVVGTRFTVTRRPEVRVDVAHGKVRVVASGREAFVAAGERWPAETAATDPVPVPSAPVAPMPGEPAPPHGDPVPPAPAPASEPRVSSRDAFVAAQRLEAHDWPQAARAYRTISRGGDRWAALALYSLAELEAAHDHAKDALAALDDYQRRFPTGASAEDGAWLRVEALRSLGRTSDARAAAAAYLKRFPVGTYVTPASRLAPP